MALYLIGDIQGCLQPLERLLEAVDFSPSRDTLYPLGDLVNRGPDSLGVLRRLATFEGAARPLLGNHDLHLLAVSAGLRAPRSDDTLAAILQAEDRRRLISWLREQALARLEHGWLMVHAGLLPTWTPQQALALAGEVQSILRGPQWTDFLAHMYGNQPDQWREDLEGWDRLRLVVNALTRLRFCTPEGVMEFKSTDPPDQPPPGHLPWFSVPGRQSANQAVAFGHWSTLSIRQPRRQPVRLQNTLGLDTGCLWGGPLTAARLGARPGDYELIGVSGEKQAHPSR
ncbi:MAG: symmetrical bis(5'-nucleosyl)-tetraphosphatase [Betaproteobacteria bacterium]|nr:symmetrical bis(5'-nucleosyl)-tetraphosphatase [Betaproteobacteria bacterium]